MSEQMISLADLGDIDVTDIPEVRFENLPEGVMGFEVVEAALKEHGDDPSERRVYAEFKVKVVEVVTLIDAAKDPTTVVDKTHAERVNIPADDPMAGLGRIRAMVGDMGCPNEGKLNAILAGTIGHRFYARMLHRKSPKDPSVIFANLRFEKEATTAAV